MIRLAAPEWLLLLPMLALAGWLWRRLELQRPLRAAALLLLVLALAKPEWRRFGSGLDLWVLVDRSASAADLIATRLAEWEGLLARSMGPRDRLRFVDFADVPVTRAEGTASDSGDREQTRAALAVEHALAQMAPARASRLLVFTDGFSTEPFGDLAERLRAQEVAIDYRLVTAPDAADTAVADFRLPSRAQPGEPFILEVDLAGSPDGAVPYEVRRDGAVRSSGVATLLAGRARLRIADQSARPGAHRYEVRIRPGRDSRSGNNAATRWIEIVGGPRVLLITAYVDDPVARSLRAQGFAVEVVRDLATLDVGRLAGARAVVFNNVPAHLVPGDFLSALDVYVRTQGGGLLMIGGRQSFGSGGYFASPLDPLLPVSMELRSEIRKLAVAMAIVLDRSGSMSAGVSPGVTKMDLANEGAARAIELLGAQDAVATLAVDSEPHVVVPMTGVGADRAALVDRVRRVTSGGGGIYVFNGLAAGWKELQKADAGQRHLVLFADAADAEQPGDYQRLIDEMVAGGATISVIGLGSDADPDAAFLKDVAARGKGRIFFHADANTLPGLFEQETVAIARSAFLDTPVRLTPTAGWLEIAAAPLEWPAAVDGYNLSYLRPDATGAVFSDDEFRAPLVAFWQRGPGRTAAVTFPLGGDFSARVRAWPGYGDLVQTLTRWLMGEELPPGLGLRTRVDGTELRVDLSFDETWEERFAKRAPELYLAAGATGKPRRVAWRRLAPGHYAATTHLPSGEWVRGAVQVEGKAIDFGPLNSGANPEWSLDRRRVNEFRALSRASGGVERLDLDRVWQAPRRSAFTDLSGWLLALFGLVFLADVFVTRVGWRWRRS